MRFTPEYKALLEQHRAEKDANWGPGQDHLAPVVETYVRLANTKVVLDYGCGGGSLVSALRAVGIDARGYDPMVAEWSAEPTRAGIVVCSDVLEHIEPECLDDVLNHIWNKTVHGALVLISTVPAKSILPDGRNAHLIVQDQAWWASKLREHFSHVVWIAPHDAVFYCIP